MLAYAGKNMVSLEISLDPSWGAVCWKAACFRGPCAPVDHVLQESACSRGAAYFMGPQATWAVGATCPRGQLLGVCALGTICMGDHILLCSGGTHDSLAGVCWGIPCFHFDDCHYYVS